MKFREVNLLIKYIILCFLFLSAMLPFANAGTNSICWDEYIEKINDKINSNWHPPLEEGVNNIVVSYEIDKSGDLINCEIVESSGSVLSDNAALEAIKNSSPFDALPEEYRGNSLSVEYKFKHNYIDYSADKTYDEYDDKKLSQWKSYMHNFNKQIKTNWVPPDRYNNDKIIANITISKAGKLLQTDILDSQETEEINKTVLDTIENSAPFEPLPEDFDGEFITIEYNFNNVADNIEQDEPQSFENFSTKTPQWKLYMQNLNNKVISNWVQPANLHRYRTVVIFSVKKDGSLTNYKISEPSVSQESNDNAINAIINSAPFEPLPEDFAGESVSIKFIFDKNTIANAMNTPKTKYIPMDNTDILFFLDSLNKQRPKKEKKVKQKDKQKDKDKDHYIEEIPEH